MSANDSKRETRAALWAELQSIAEHDGELTPQMADDFDRIEGEIRTLDAGIRADAVRERFASMSTEPAAPAIAAPGSPSTPVENRDADGWDAALRYWRSGGRDMSAIHTRSLNTVEDTAVVPDDLQAEVVRLMGAAQGARQAVRVTQAPTDARVPVVSTRVSVTAFSPETDEADATEPTFSEADFSTDAKAFAKTELSDEILQDARIDLVSEVTLQHAEELGRLWSHTYCNGSGSNTDAIFNASQTGINTVTAASATAITAQELIDMRYGADGLPAQYWTSMGPLSWIMGQDTYAAILGLTDGNDRPLFQAAAMSTMSQAIPGTLLGLPVHIDAGAPALATGNTTVALVAQNAYRVVDRAPGLVTRLDPYSKQTAGKVVINSYWRSVGRYVRPQAACVLTMA